MNPSATLLQIGRHALEAPSTIARREVRGKPLRAMMHDVYIVREPGAIVIAQDRSRSVAATFIGYVRHPRCFSGSREGDGDKKCMESIQQKRILCWANYITVVAIRRKCSMRRLYEADQQYVFGMLINCVTEKE
ncbi:unnamed protein product [Lactuca saligna]|uniref:Uncharacterized protein n=1 Tax=Lactuca saligna TaxID=75948 RepID=A0AA35Z253_LACSI|nr:unnamed protein product [Lactuca saligna]